MGESCDRIDQRRRGDPPGRVRDDDRARRRVGDDQNRWRVARDAERFGEREIAPVRLPENRAVAFDRVHDLAGAIDHAIDREQLPPADSFECWTGTGWTRDQDKARRFASQQDALDFLSLGVIDQQ